MPGTVRGVGRGLLIGLGSVVLLAVLFVLIITNTPWGRDQVRGFAEAQLNEVVEGQVEIGRLDGNLIVGGTLRDMSIVDPEGRPFVTASEIGWRHSLSELVGRRIVLTRLEFSGLDLVLDQRPDEDWNFARIFEPEEAPDPDPAAAPGLGDWIELREIRGEEFHVAVRMPWEPNPELTVGEREEQERRARAGEGLERVEEVPEGLQSVMAFRVSEAHLPRVVLAEPESDEIRVDLAHLSGGAEPFRSPEPGVVEHLSARLRVGPELLEVEEFTLALPASELSGHVVFVPESSALQAAVDAPLVTLDDLRFLYPPLPREIEGQAALAVQLDEHTTRATLGELEIRVGEGRLEGGGGIEFGDRLVLDDTELRLEGIRTRFVEELLGDDVLPELTIPEHGELSGRVAVTSLDEEGSRPPARVDARIGFRSEAGHTSSIGIEGGVIPGEEIRLAGLTVRLDPLRTELVRAVAPQTPLRGEIRGQATLDGPLTGPLAIDGALAHMDPAVGTSRVSATARVAFVDELRVSDGVVHLEGVQVGLLREVDPELPLGGTIDGIARLDGTLDEELRFETEFLHRQAEDESSRLLASGEVATDGDGRFAADVALDDVSLVTAGRFAPDAGLRGDLNGEGRFQGSFRELDGSLRLELPGGGLLESEGALDLTGDSPLYRLGLTLGDLDLSALSGRVRDETSLAGSVQARGEGTDPAELAAELSAELLDDGPWRSIDEGEPEVGAELPSRHLTARLAMDRGLVRVDTLTFEMASAYLDARGSFGLTDERSGALEYRVSVDSLHLLEPLVPADPELVEPRPSVREAAVEVREEDLARIVRDAQVEHLATGDRPGLPELEELPGLEGIPRDRMDGSLEIFGVLEGHTGHFDAQGGMNAEGLIVLGNRVEHARGSYALAGVARTPSVGDQPAPEADEDQGPDLVLEATAELEAEGLFLAGFEYDRVETEVAIQTGEVQSGDLALSVRQDPETGVRVAGAFELAGESGEARLDDLTLEFEDALYRLPRPGVVRWDDRRVELADVILESDIEAGFTATGVLPLREVDAQDTAPDDESLALSLNAFELGHLAHLAQMEPDLAGHLDLEVEWRGSLERPVIHGTTGLTGVTLADHPLPELQAEVDYAEERLTLDARALQEERRILVAEARLPLDLGLIEAPEERLLEGPIAAEARLEELRLEGFDALVEEIAGIAGRVDGELRLSGSYEDARVAGGMDVIVPTVFVEPLGIRVDDLAGRVSFDDRLLRVDSIVAYSRGPIRMSGEVDLAELAEPTFELAIEATDAQAIRTADVRARADAQIEVAGTLDEVVVTGEVRTREGVVRIPSTEELAEPVPLDLEDPALRARLDPRLVQEIDRLVDTPPVLQNLQVELDLHIARGMWVRSPDANVEFSTPPAIGPLRVRMNGVRPEDIGLEGTVQSDRGEYEFMSRRFSLSRGTVTFVEGAPLEPLIRLTAEHEVQLPGREPFDVRIVLDGTPTDLETELESTAEPPLSQTDLLSFVVFGRDAGSLLAQPGSALSGQGSSGGPLVGQVASRAAQQFATVGFDAVLGQVEAETARTLGLDVLNIRPAEIPAEISTGEFADLLRGTEFEAGRYVTSRLFISGQARPTFVHPGARMDYETEHGWVWRVTWRPRFLPAVPTLLPEEPDRASVFGSLIFREWRF